jgi:hypothetical protein
MYGYGIEGRSSQPKISHAITRFGETWEELPLVSLGWRSRHSHLN